MAVGTEHALSNEKKKNVISEVETIADVIGRVAIFLILRVTLGSYRQKIISHFYVNLSE